MLFQRISHGLLVSTTRKKHSSVSFRCGTNFLSTRLDELRLGDDEASPTNVLEEPKKTIGIPRTPMSMLFQLGEPKKDTGETEPSVPKRYGAAVQRGKRAGTWRAPPILLQLLGPRAVSNLADVPQALLVLQGLIDATPADAKKDQITWQVFGLVLNTLIQHRLYSDIKTLVQEMRLRNVLLQGPVMTTHICSMIEKAHFHEEAFECYKVLRSVNPSKINSLTLANYFINKVTKIPQFPRAAHVFDIIDQANKTSLEFQPHQTITNLLNCYSINLYRWNERKENREKYPDFPTDIRKEVDEVGKYIRAQFFDPPDIHVWTSLLNGYNFTGNFSSCFELWDELRATDMVNPVTVSVMMDACGRAGQLELAQRTWAELRAEGIPLDKKNWNGYVECLALAGPLGHAAAMGVVLDEMGENGCPDGKVPGATIETLSILLVHSWDAGIRNIIELLQERLPDLMQRIESMAVAEGSIFTDQPNIPQSSSSYIYKAIRSHSSTAAAGDTQLTKGRWKRNSHHDSPLDMRT
ncbi:hypothetical protein DACRYDRAFT_102132 [Dacryopinax primogenitus]|uniref:Pentacotripeptide-repeat region of PRORP domain-containing protein n=1 Tax=Dacryopinax primogenitus (strain DJM 731) TaxID=1858805 RepID=M5FRV4_DACPD|nr:uncharacterized protein DACRYDRAFT_102132 [Dacryopinax primogenitus]EJT97789.1 hypothetical protein DACRYDRAFT_102132 [Dacryopinax primogenitus]